MKGNSSTVGGQRSSRPSHMEAWESVGTFNSFPSSSQWLAPGQESHLGNRRRLQRNEAEKHRVITEDSFSAMLRSLSFILKAMVAPEGL